MSEPSTMRAWRVHEYGTPRDVLQMDEVPVPEPGAGELRVRVEAFALNLNDLERVNGQNMMVRPPLPTIPGMEVMGVVDACGEGVEGREGERVVAQPKQAFGGYAEYAICGPEAAFEMPAEIALPDAAALYFPFHLAWLGLFERARLEAGETVLVHAAAGGAGSAAVQLARTRGARVIATASTEEKRALCAELGADLTLDYGEGLVEAVLDATDGRGVEVVFDNVGEAVMADSMKCIAYDGRYVMNGFASDKSVVDAASIVPRSIAAGNFKLCGVLMAYAPEPLVPMMKRGMGWNFVPSSVGARITREVCALVTAGKVRAVIGRVASFDEVPEALEALVSRATTGRTVVRL